MFYVFRVELERKKLKNINWLIHLPRTLHENNLNKFKLICQIDIECVIQVSLSQRTAWPVAVPSSRVTTTFTYHFCSTPRCRSLYTQTQISRLVKKKWLKWWPWRLFGICDMIINILLISLLFSVTISLYYVISVYISSQFYSF